MLRVGRNAFYPTDVLPALLVLGAGLVTLIAPLTSTVLSSVETARAGLASGVNNAAARAAGLMAVAALPFLTGMGPQAYHSATAFDRSFDKAMPICAGIMITGALVAFLTVRRPAPAEPEQVRAAPECRMSCGLSAPPLEQVPAETSPGQRQLRAPS